MDFEVLTASSADRESMVVELWWQNELAVEIWEEQGEMRCALFQRRNGKPHKFPLAKFLESLNRAWGLLQPPK